MATTPKLLIAAAGACLALGINGAEATQATIFPNTRNLVESVSQKPTCNQAPKLHAELLYITVCDVYVRRTSKAARGRWNKWVFKGECDPYTGNKCTFISNPGTLKVVNCRSVPIGRGSALPQNPAWQRLMSARLVAN